MSKFGTALYARVRSLHGPLRSLIGVYWTYVFVSGLTTAFTQIFLYSRFESLQLNVVGLMLFYTGCMTSLCGFGYIAGRFQLPIKQGFFWSLIAVALSFALLLLADTPEIAYIALFLGGVGEGFFWLTLHTLELKDTHNDERDFYASLLSVGDRILTVAAPLCATVLIWISGSILRWGTFTLLFIAAPLIYILGIVIFKTLSDYRPSRIHLSDLTHFLTNGRFKTLQLNVAGEAFDNTIGIVVLPLVFLAILGNTINVGIFTTIIAIASALFVISTAGYRTVSNRFSVLAVTTVLMVGSLLWVGYAFTFLALIGYAVMKSTAYPLMSVSNRVIALRSMELTSRPGSDFFAAFILRDFFLWAWRMLIALMFLCGLHFTGSGQSELSVGLYLIAGGLVITLLAARYIVRWR